MAMTLTAIPVTKADETSARFARALKALCGALPPADWVDLWVADEQLDGEDPLVAWVSDRMAGNALGDWVSPHQLINAASVLAQTPMRSDGLSRESVSPDAAGALGRALDEVAARRDARARSL